MRARTFPKTILMIFLIVFLFIPCLGAQQFPLGDIGKPPDYNATIMTQEHGLGSRVPEVLAKLGIAKPDDQRLLLDGFVQALLPTSFNWADYGNVTAAKDQGSCGSCWAFTSVGALESKLLMMGEPALDLSEQQLVSCQGGSCRGGSMWALRYWFDHGPMEEACTGYPSLAWDINVGDTPATRPPCATLSTCGELGYRTGGYYTVNTNNTDDVKMSLIEDGPAYFRFDVYTDFMRFWSNSSAGDVYVNTPPEPTDVFEGGHAVLIIGWDDNLEAWLCKNSWGETAGPEGDGTFWIAWRGHHTGLSFGMGTVSSLIEDNGLIALSPEADTYIRNDLPIRSNDNYGMQQFIMVGTKRFTGEADYMRSLVRFNLDLLPPGFLVGRAFLEATIFGFDHGACGVNYQVDVHRVLEAWEEGNGFECPHSNYPCGGPPGSRDPDNGQGVSWDTQPGFMPLPEASATATQCTVHNRGNVLQWDLTNMVQEWFSGNIPNHGLVLIDPTSDGTFRGIQFAAKEGEIFDLPGSLTAPRLLVTPLQTLTNGEPKGSFDTGYQTDEVTQPETWRWSRYYYGFDGIDEIKWMKDGSGQWHNYLIGWHQNDLAEYLMKFGGEYSRLILRGVADRPGPVKVNIYVDGAYKATAAWDNNNNRNQDVVVDIPGIHYGTHAIAVEFDNDFWDPRGRADGDRNMYLDGLLVTRSPQEIPSLTGGEPKGVFGDGSQTDEVTGPETWRWAEDFYGFQGIDKIKWMKDGSGQWHNYVIGWHQNDLAEYLMKFGGTYDRLTLRGIADRPGPVRFEVYVDGQYKATAEWNKNNNCNQDVSVKISGIPYGTHAIAVKFVNDYWDPRAGADGDRNLYLDGLRVTE